jgi:ribonuclease HI
MARGIWKPKKNKELSRNLKQLTLLMQEKHKLKWEWIKGHSNNAGNEVADELANNGCKGRKLNHRENWNSQK